MKTIRLIFLTLICVMTMTTAFLNVYRAKKFTVHSLTPLTRRLSITSSHAEDI